MEISVRIVKINVSLALLVVLLICLPLGGNSASITPRRQHSGEIENYLRASILHRREQSSDNLDDESNTDAMPQVNDDAPSEWIANYDDSSRPSETYDKQEHRRHSDAVDPVLANRFLREQRKRRRVRRHAAIVTIQSLTNNLQSRSVCSWTYRINHDITRTPVELPEAVCSNTAVAGSRSRCEQVYYNVPVRKLEISESGETVWVDERMPVKVGCTLATPASVPYTLE